MSTDEEWEKWGAQDPYFAVLTDPKYRSAALDDLAVEEFFESGKMHVEYVFSRCANILGRPFRPVRVLDFGCGVGRVAVQMAKIAESVVGLDVSESMLREARSNAQRFGVGNLELGISDDALSMAGGEFDLVHSTIVLQHIGAERGRGLFANLVRKVCRGGVGAIQVTYGSSRFPSSFGQPSVVEAEPPSRLELVRQLIGPRRRRVAKAEVVKPPSGAGPDPEMQMNAYSLNELAFMMQTAGVVRFEADFTDHGGALGVTIYFRKP
jgi:SAM-dependent methyltransferase